MCKVHSPYLLQSILMTYLGPLGAFFNFWVLTRRCCLLLGVRRIGEGCLSGKTRETREWQCVWWSDACQLVEFLPNLMISILHQIMLSITLVLNDGQVHAGGGELPVRGGGRHRLHPDLLRPPHPPQDRPHPRPLDQVYHAIYPLDSRRVPPISLAWPGW